MENNYEVVVSLICIFYDKQYNQTDPNYIKILLDEKKVINKKISIFHKDIKNCIEELFSEYIKINYEWPSKELVSCRKIDNKIEITYITSMPFINGSLKKGSLYNITDFINIIQDNYYAESITRA
jgi:hypothetical protein